MESKLRPGFALDLEELKPDGTPWDLRKKEDVRAAERLQDQQEPYLLTGSPPCEKFSVLQGLNGKVDSEKRKADLEEARHHLDTAAHFSERQFSQGRFFLH